MSLSFLHEGDFPELYDYFIIPDVVNITCTQNTQFSFLFMFRGDYTSQWGRKESDTTERLIWSDLMYPKLFWEVDQLTSSDQWNVHEYDFNLIFSLSWLPAILWLEDPVNLALHHVIIWNKTADLLTYIAHVVWERNTRLLCSVTDISGLIGYQRIT